MFNPGPVPDFSTILDQSVNLTDQSDQSRTGPSEADSNILMNEREMYSESASFIINHKL